MVNVRNSIDVEDFDNGIRVIVGPWESCYGFFDQENNLHVFIGWHLSSARTRTTISAYRAIADEEHRGKPDWGDGTMIVQNKTSDVPELFGTDYCEFLSEVEDSHREAPNLGTVW